MPDFRDRETLDLTPPPHLEDIEAATEILNFNLASIATSGALAAHAGTGMATCWRLDGLDSDGHLVTVDNDPVVQPVAKINLGHDPRISFVEQDASEFLHSTPSIKFDLIFADALPGKFCELDETLPLLVGDGVYVCGDLLPQENWPESQAPNVLLYIDNMPRGRAWRSNTGNGRAVYCSRINPSAKAKKFLVCDPLVNLRSSAPNRHRPAGYLT